MLNKKIRKDEFDLQKREYSVPVTALKPEPFYKKTTFKITLIIIGILFFLLFFVYKLMHKCDGTYQYNDTNITYVVFLENGNFRMVKKQDKNNDEIITNDEIEIEDGSYFAIGNKAIIKSQKDSDYVAQYKDGHIYFSLGENQIIMDKISK